jgi:hypothetical protein
VYGTEVLRGRLTYLLEQAVRSSPAVNRRFGPTDADFGLPMNGTGDPMLVVNRAECLLALYMMTEEKVPVEFLDADRFEVRTMPHAPWIFVSSIPHDINLVSASCSEDKPVLRHHTETSR